jgi:7-carboxy-7-deazaguanine synthase
LLVHPHRLYAIWIANGATHLSLGIGQAKTARIYDKAKETKRMSVANICEQIDHNCERIVISGGEPMLQQKNLLLLVSKLISFGHTVEIETNGTLLPSDDWAEIAKVHFNVSPKLFHSGVSKEKAIKVEA